MSAFSACHALSLVTAIELDVTRCSSQTAPVASSVSRTRLLFSLQHHTLPLCLSFSFAFELSFLFFFFFSFFAVTYFSTSAVNTAAIYARSSASASPLPAANRTILRPCPAHPRLPPSYFGSFRGAAIARRHNLRVRRGFQVRDTETRCHSCLLRLSICLCAAI